MTYLLVFSSLDAKLTWRARISRRVAPMLGSSLTMF
jgi:hypothetical protein